jgi:hypothetical protein
MSAHPPIGACCYRPRFNAVGGVDDFTWTSNLQGHRHARGVCKLERAIAFAVAGILATLAVACAYTLFQP